MAPASRARLLRVIGVVCLVWLGLSFLYFAALSVFPATEETADAIQAVLFVFIAGTMLGSVAAATFLVVVHHRRFDRPLVWIVLLGVCVVAYGANEALSGQLDSRNALPTFLFGMSWWALFVAFLVASVRKDAGLAVLGGFFAFTPWLLAILWTVYGDRITGIIHPEEFGAPMSPLESWMGLYGRFFIAFAPMALVSFAVHTAVALYREIFGLSPGSMDPRKRVLEPTPRGDVPR